MNSLKIIFLLLIIFCTISCGNKNKSKDRTTKSLNLSTGQIDTVQILDEPYFDRERIYTSEVGTLTFYPDGKVKLDDGKEYPDPNPIFEHITPDNVGNYNYTSNSHVGLHVRMRAFKDVFHAFDILGDESIKDLYTEIVWALKK